MTLVSPRALRLLARCLLAAMVLAMLAPSVSRALAAERSAGDWVQICTAQGMEWIQLNADGSPGGADDLLAVHDLCGHCVLAAERFAPLPPSLPEWQPPAGRPAVTAGVDDLSPGGTLPLRHARGPPEPLT